MEQLNEAISNFLKGIQDLQRIEEDNMLSDLPTDEREEYEEKLEAFNDSEEVINMIDLVNRIESLYRKSK